jgi:hypothetical protein
MAARDLAHEAAALLHHLSHVGDDLNQYQRLVPTLM